MKAHPADSLDDPRLADYRELHARPMGRPEFESHFVVEGQLLVRRLVDSDYRLRSLLVDADRDLTKLGTLPEGVPVLTLSREQMRSLVGFDFHRGVLASADRRPLPEIERFRPSGVALGLVNLSDMENLGSLLRSAAAFGIRDVLLDRSTVDPFNRRTLRVSMGAALTMRFWRMARPEQAYRELGQRGVRTLASTLADDAVALAELPSDPRPTVLVLGNEGLGLPEPVQHACQQRVTIPMGGREQEDGSVDSLNVSVAAAVMMYELIGRRATSGNLSE